MTETSCKLRGHWYIISKYLPGQGKYIFSKSKDCEAQQKVHMELTAPWSKILASKPEKHEVQRLK